MLLLSPAHLDESKPTWMSPSPVAKPKPDWSSYGVSISASEFSLSHAPREVPRATTRTGEDPRARAKEGGSRASTRQPRAEKACHAPSRAREVNSPRATRVPRARGVLLDVRVTHAPGRCQLERRHAVPSQRGLADSALTVDLPLGGDVPGEDISEQSLIDEEAYEFEALEGDYSGGTYERVPEFESWETLVVSLSNSAPNGKLITSMVMDALFNEEARRREMGSTDQRRWRSQARGHTVRCFYCDQEGHIKRDCPKYKAQDQSSDTAATAVMAVDESEVLLAASEDGKSDWVLDSGSAYHLCRDREVFSTYAACEGRIWMANNTASRVVGRGSVRFRMADGRDAGLTLVEEFSEFPRETRRCCGERKTGGLYRLEGSVQTGGATVRHESNGISKEKWTREATVAQSEGRGDAEASLFCSRFDQWRCSLQLCAQGRRDGATTTRKVTYFAAHPGGGWGAPQWGGAGHLGEKSYGGAGSEVVRKDNLKTSDYPPVGWRGRLLSPTHLDESKPTWMSPSPVAKPKPDWSSYGVSM
ncbi:hypothetical protein Acr_00g0062660 [Actinidia rufa]|uniref:CCHC-type domain-containing protein n=1 Tax=Actinidia rufa TaxID=165716 RepID=A0A7J0DP92_9ERIC|nr:hypothetical protein Acr_00g0062660 [Actinidia rufa]